MRLITNICEFYHKQGFSPKTFFRRKTLNLIIRHLNLLFSNDPLIEFMSPNFILLYPLHAAYA